MLIELLVRLLGGFWKLKQRCKEAQGLVQRIYLIVYQVHQFYHGASIAYNAEFENMPILPHGMSGIFVSGEARIGRNCVLFQHVTIGSNSLLDSKGMGAPTIGDHCYIGAGAKVIGNVRVGNNVRVGANAVVHKDVPDNSVVTLGAQSVIVRDTPPNNRFYTFRNGRWCYFRDGRFLDEKDPAALTRLNSIRSSRADSTKLRQTN